MPGQTDNYAIRYPCPGDTISAADVANWASDIDAALAEVSLAASEATLRPRAMLRTPDAGVAIAAGALTQIIFTTEVYNEGVSTSGLGGFQPEPTGSEMLMLLAAQFTPVNTATTVTSFRAQIMSGNVPFSRTLASSAVPTIAKPMTLIALGHVDFIFGAICQFEWTGTGGPLNIYCQFSCQYVAPSVP